MNKLLLKRNERTLLYALPAVTDTQIVCGDCSAPPLHWIPSGAVAGPRSPVVRIDELRTNPWPERPIKSLLTLDGRCNRCGSRNYQLASVLSTNAALKLLTKLGRVDDLERLYSQETK